MTHAAAMTLAVELWLTASPALAETVDLALVLAADNSGSVDEDEFRLQRQGYAAALTSPAVLDAIKRAPHQAIAVTFIEWSGIEQQKVIAEWAVIRDGATAAVFASAIVGAPRGLVGGTSISAAIDFAVRYFAKSGIESERKIIDISGDGTNNDGPPVTKARDDAVAVGITINGLAIVNEHRSPEDPHTHPPGGILEYYRQNVIGGRGAFALVAKDPSSFGQAVVDKLLGEIAKLQAPFGARNLAAHPAPSASVDIPGLRVGVGTYIGVREDQQKKPAYSTRHALAYWENVH